MRLISSLIRTDSEKGVSGSKSGDRERTSLDSLITLMRLFTEANIHSLSNNTSLVQKNADKKGRSKGSGFI